MRLLWVIACGGGSVVEEAPPIDVDPGPAWSALGLPLGEGRVVAADADMLTVEYPRGLVRGREGASGHGETWARALTERGWTTVVDTSGPAMVSMRLEREGAALALGVFEGIDGVTVTLARLEVPP